MSLTAVGQDERGQGRERLISGNIETPIVQWLDLVVLHVVPTTILPVLDAQRETIRIVLGRTHEECATRILLGQQQLIGLLP